MMKINHSISRDKKISSESNLLKTNDNEINKENDDFNYPKRENIINDLKQKGFNELQIDDIFETFKRNSVSNRYPLIKEGNYIRILDNYTLDNYSHSNIRKNKIVDDKINNSKYKNSFVIKTENNKNPLINKNKPKYNCAKLYVNASSEKYRKSLLYLKDKKENKYKNNIKTESLGRNIVKDIIIPAKNSITNRAYSRKINNNNKVGNYINKFKLSYRNSINDIEERKNEMLKKYECDDNYNNYNFKIIFETKNSRNSANNIGYLDIKNMKNKNIKESYYKSRNEIKEENKNNNSTSVTDCNNNNDFFYKKYTIDNKNELISYRLMEKKEENENNQFKEIKVNLNRNLIMNNNKDIEFEKKAIIKNKRKIYTQRRKDLKTFDEINKEKKNLKDNFNNFYKNKFERKLFSDINNFNQKENQISNNYQQNNILVIRKQNTEEGEKLAQRNISISIIKQDSFKNSIPILESKSCRKNNHLIKLEKSIKSKSLSKISEKNNSNHNHNFVNINLCKNKVKNCSTFYANRGLSIEEKEKSETSLEEINSSNEKNETNNISINDLSNSLNSSNKVSNQENINNFNKKTNITNITNIIRLNKAPFKNLNTKTNNYIKLSNNNIKPKNISFNYVTKKYPNGNYKGYILNDKREKTGIMIFDNGAKYEGQWKNDKKNGKGVFTSSHYYDCENFVGMKYEGEFKDDKFDGYGITTYTNGDRYEGEWKNNKQYGSGTVTYFNGEKYEGEWKEGMFDGIGTFFLKNGERFEGRFKNNKYNGYGKYFYLNGNWLEGVFKNDHPSGNCFLHKTDGSVVNVAH